MQSSASHAHTSATDSSHGHAHHEPGFFGKYIFSTDHKVIGIQYGVSSLLFLMFGFLLMLVMRFQLANPGKAIPVVGALLEKVLGEDMAKGGIMGGDLYNSFGAMHGTIMVFLAIVPVLFGAFGNYVTPLQIGAPDMAFPRLNMASFHCYFLGGVVMFASFFTPGGAARSGWTSYSPLASVTDLANRFDGQTYWLMGMVLLITSSLLGSVNFIGTIIQLRCRGMSWMRMPFFVWAQFVTGFLLLLAFPPLEAAGLMQLMDNLFGSSFFLPQGLVVNGTPLPVSGGGSPLLWQHLFWFLGHPEVYVLILPAIGIVAEVISNNIRKPLWGYKSMVYAAMSIGFLSFIVWAHHMYLTGMGTKVATFFQTTTMMISIPSVIILTALFISLWGGSIRFNSASLFALSFLPMFGIGGLTGLPLGFNASDIFLHDSYYVIGHFHYVVAPGTMFAVFAGIYYWFPKITGRHMNELLGKIHWAGSLFFMNCVFAPMFIQGFKGMSRRMSDGGTTYFGPDAGIGADPGVLGLNKMIFMCAIGLGFAQIPFIINFFSSIFAGKRTTSDNPWQATTLEWATPTPPPHGNFLQEPVAYRGPYEYSVPGAKTDFTPQGDKN